MSEHHEGTATSPITGNRHGSAVVSLPSDTEYRVTRAFDAPAELIFRAWTTPDLVKRWWGFETSEWRVCEIDLREGGTWRYVIVEKGNEVGFHGDFHEIAAPHRLVFTEMFEGVVPLPPRDEYPVNVMTLEEHDGVTTMTVHVTHKSAEERDAVLATGMESGMQVSYDRLEDLVRRS
jgi:uncharacterized protein YndB with AHSA1/START domain